MSVQIAFESPDQTEVIALIDQLDAYHLSLYPPESVYALDLPSLMRPNVRFVVARDVDGAAVGCGAVVLTPQGAELKRMYVRPASRGQGVAGRVLRLLETTAQAEGCQLMQLETGPYQPEALAMYARHGYAQRGPYGEYPNDPLSVFMEKQLAA